MQKGNYKMEIEKWQQFGSIRDFDDLFSKFLGTRGVKNTEPEAWSTPLDVVQSGDSLVVTASVPGVPKDEIDVSVDDNVLTIKAESTSSTGWGSAEDSDGFLLRERELVRTTGCYGFPRPSTTRMPSRFSKTAY